MLVLSRKANESIVINGNIRITVASIRGRIVRIGIEAPSEIGIYREELRSDPTTVPRPDSRDLRHHIPANHTHRPVAPVGGSEVDGAMVLDA